jgi:glutaredoxin
MKQSLKDSLITLTLILLCIWSAWNFVFKERGIGAGEVSPELAARVHSELGGAVPDDPAVLSDKKVQGKPVLLFVTSWCGVCRSLERNLTSANIEFTVVDIEKNIDAGGFYQAIMGPRAGPVPVTLVGSRVFVGDQTRAIISASKAI